MANLARIEGGNNESFWMGLNKSELRSSATKLLDKKEQNNSRFLRTKLVNNTELSPRASPTALSTTSKKSRKSVRVVEEEEEGRDSRSLPKTPKHHSMNERI